MVTKVVGVDVVVSQDMRQHSAVSLQDGEILVPMEKTDSQRKKPSTALCAM